MTPGLSASTKPKADWKPSQPNILITGTPGVGKSELSKRLSQELGLRHIDVSAFARERDLLADFDASLNTYYMHEDAVLDELEPLMTTGGIVLDHHSVDWFPERWVQIAVVLRARTDILYDRLINREYGKGKLENNMQAEIMEVILDETVNAYSQLTILQLDSNTDEDVESNLKTIKKAWNGLIHRDNRIDSQTTQNDVVH